MFESITNSHLPRICSMSKESLQIYFCYWQKAKYTILKESETMSVDVSEHSALIQWCIKSVAEAHRPGKCTWPALLLMLFFRLSRFPMLFTAQIFGSSLELPMQFMDVFGHFFGKVEASCVHTCLTCTEISLTWRAHSHVDLCYMWRWGFPYVQKYPMEPPKLNSSLLSIVDIGLCIVILTSAECSYHCNSVVKVLHT